MVLSGVAAPERCAATSAAIVPLPAARFVWSFTARARPSHNALVPRDTGAQDFVGVALPPGLGGKNFHLAMAAVAGRLPRGADCAQIDDAVAHHAAVEQEIGGWHEPVVDVVRENFSGGACDLLMELGPHQTW